MTREAVLFAFLAVLGGCELLDGSPETPERAAPWSPPGSSEAGAAADAGSVSQEADAATTHPDDAGGPSSADVSLPDERPAVAVAAGYEHTCALTRAGLVWCWGANGNGQLGNGSTAPSAVPTSVKGLEGTVIAISAGTDHTCALLAGEAASSVQCWGRNDHGQLGDGTTADRSSPVAVTGLPGSILAIATGGLHTCAVAGGGVWCWGDDADGQLGDGASQDRSTPVSPAGISGATAIAAGGAHTCAVAGGSVQCWGFGANGQLGVGSTTSSSTPVTVTSLGTTATHVCAGNEHTCALTTGSGATCWGYGQYGQLGDDATADRTTPTAVQSLSGNVPAMAGGAEHTCALDANGGAWCWGEDESGQLGDNGAADSPVPVSVVGIASGATGLAAGEAHTCAVVGGGGIQCWGWNVSGQLGNGTQVDSATPVEVAGF